MFFIPLFHLHLLIYSIYLYWPYIDPTLTPHWPYTQLFFNIASWIVKLDKSPPPPHCYCFPPPPPPPPHFYCFRSTTTTTTTTFLLFSLYHHHHHRHRHISIVFAPPPPPLPPRFYCFPSITTTTTVTATFLLFPSLSLALKAWFWPLWPFEEKQ